MTTEQFLRQLAKWGVRFTEAAGWRTRNRNTAGLWGPVEGVLLHHTGDDAPDDADQRVLTNGRADLPGPLCHWGMRDDGVAVLIGWGRANHAGRGAANVRDALLSEGYGSYPPAPGADSVDGNAILYGQETMYSGAKAPTSAAYAATVRIFAAICDFHGWSAKSCIGHKEWTARKPDPGHLDMAQFRRDVDAALEAGVHTPTIQEDNVPLTPADLAAVEAAAARAIRTYFLAPPESDLRDIGDGAASPPLRLLQMGGRQALLARNAVASLAAAVAGLDQVDEAALAADLAPLLATQVQHFTDADLATLADAVNDVRDARERTRLGS